MRSDGPGARTSGAELTNVSPHGLWLLVDGRELFLPFEDFPWFREASIAQIARIERPAPGHLRWPDLDLDLSVDSIDDPQRYPLSSALGAEVRESPDGDPGQS